MRKNKIKQMMKDGKPVINGWCAIPSTASAEAMAHQGWDSLTIDMQHGLVDYSNALPMLQTISTTDVTPLARVNWNEPGQIMKILDAGCYGIICPMVSNKEEAEKFVQLISEPTHIEGHLLDQAYLQDKQDKLDVTTEVHSKYYTDHKGLAIILKKKKN